MNVADIMTREVVYVTPATPVSQVAKLLVDYGISGVPVLEGGVIVGIVTEEDLVMRDAIIDMPHFFGVFDSVFYLATKHEFDEEMQKILATEARDLMTSNVVSITDDASVQALATLMIKKEVNPVPVVNKAGELVGVVSRSDLVRLMVAEEEAGLAGEPPVSATADEQSLGEQ